MEIPGNLNFDEEETKKLTTVPIEEKNLSYGPSSSLTGKLFKVQYVV
jgi:hypothetical protein